MDSVEGASGADAEAVDFDRFFADEYRRLFRALLLICRDRPEADDIAQEVFVRVFERWDRVGRMDAPVSYLYRTALNEYRNRVRRAIRWGRRTLFVREGGDEVSEAALARTEVSHALGALTRDQREAVVLVEFVGLRSDEAGAVLGVSAGAIRARVTRARAALREGRDDDG
ncbi:MAG: sigma-70 family RNA polymerase sigma factor [Actinomycetota bacterium]